MGVGETDIILIFCYCSVQTSACERHTGGEKKRQCDGLSVEAVGARTSYTHRDSSWRRREALQTHR